MLLKLQEKTVLFTLIRADCWHLRKTHWSKKLVNQKYVNVIDINHYTPVCCCSCCCCSCCCGNSFPSFENFDPLFLTRTHEYSLSLSLSLFLSFFLSFFLSSFLSFFLFLSLSFLLFFLGHLTHYLALSLSFFILSLSLLHILTFTDNSMKMSSQRSDRRVQNLDWFDLCTFVYGVGSWINDVTILRGCWHWSKCL